MCRVGVRAGNDTLGKADELLLAPYLSTRTGTLVARAAFHDRKAQLLGQLPVLKGLAIFSMFSCLGKLA